MIQEFVSHRVSFRRPDCWCPWTGADDLNEIFGSPESPLLETAKVSYEELGKDQKMNPSGKEG